MVVPVLSRKTTGALKKDYGFPERPYREYP
jgi:hypothetical protein